MREAVFQIKDLKSKKIIARFLFREDAEKFLRMKKEQDKDRYVLIESGKKREGRKPLSYKSDVTVLEIMQKDVCRGRFLGYII